MPITFTMPGTDTKVTPEMEAPTMPKATMYHGDRLSARKNVAFVARREVNRLTSSRRLKYERMVRMMVISGGKGTKKRWQKIPMPTASGFFMVKFVERMDCFICGR